MIFLFFLGPPVFFYGILYILCFFGEQYTILTENTWERIWSNGASDSYGLKSNKGNSRIHQIENIKSQ